MPSSHEREAADHHDEPDHAAAHLPQARLWNGTGGNGWVAMQAVLDRLYAPIEAHLLDTVAADPAVQGRARLRLLDVGCGSGGTTLAFARRLGPGADCLGVDIAAPMVTAARARAEAEHAPHGRQVRFIEADAQTHAFAPESFEVIASRFGVMFFSDFVAAFRQLRTAMRPGGALHFIAWRSAEENPFMTEAERAAAPCLPKLPPRERSGPGQFAMADPAFIDTLLQQSGWRGVDIQPLDLTCRMPEPALPGYLGQLGPVGRALQQVDDATRQRVLGIVRPAFDTYVHGDEVRFNAACWQVSARALSA